MQNALKKKFIQKLNTSIPFCLSAWAKRQSQQTVPSAAHHFAVL
jgi:hypothetical protein